MTHEPVTAATITRKQREIAVRLIRKHGRQIGDLKALTRAGVLGTRGQLRLLLDTDEDLAAAIASARGRDPEVIRDEIRRRAIEGVEEPVFGSLGQNMGTGEIGAKRVYSDRLLEMMAKAHLPEYRDTQRLEVTGSGGGTVRVAQQGVSLADVAAVLLAAGALHRELDTVDGGGDARRALPAAHDVLAEPPER